MAPFYNRFIQETFDSNGVIQTCSYVYEDNFNYGYDVIDGNAEDLDVKAAAAALQAKGVDQVLITLGSAGASLVKDGKFYHSSAVQGVKAVDPTAAGDSFVGAFCFATCSGMEIEDALCFANHTAALTVSKMGAMPSLPTLAEVKVTLPEHLKNEV